MKQLQLVIPILLFLGVLSGAIVPTLKAQEVDSLVRLSKESAHDSVKVRANITLGRKFETINFDSALYYYKTALTLSDSKEMQSYPFFKGMVLENIGFAYIYSLGDFRNGFTYLEKAKNSHLSNELLDEANKTQYNIGFFYSSLSQYDSALSHYNQVIDRNKSTQTKTRLQESYNNAGLMYFYKGEFAFSAKYLTQGIKAVQETGDTSELYTNYMNLGNTYLELGEYERAKFYFQKATDRLKIKGDKNSLATGFRNIAETLINQDSANQAIAILEDALKLNQETKNTIGQSMTYHYIGLANETQGNWNEALKFHQLAKDHFDKPNDRYSSSVLASLGRVKLAIWNAGTQQEKLAKISELSQVRELGEAAWSRASQSDLIVKKLAAAELLKSVYQASGKYDKALQFADSAYQFTNTINNQAQSQAIAFATTEYETERVEGENALLKQTELTQKAQIEQQNLVIWTVAIGLIALAIVAFIVFRSRAKLKNANTIIEKSLSEKELLLKEIHHRVKNNLQVISSLLELQSRGIEDEKALATFMEGQNRVKAMSLIHQKLYQNENLATIDFADYANQLLGELSEIYPNGKEVHTEIKTSGHTYFDIDTAIPLGLILNELVSNAYKYAFKEESDSEILVEINEIGKGRYRLQVGDNGIGLPEGFNPAKTKSLGLRLVRRLSKQLQGSFNVISTNGTVFKIEFSDTKLRMTS